MALLVDSMYFIFQTTWKKNPIWFVYIHDFDNFLYYQIQIINPKKKTSKQINDLNLLHYFRCYFGKFILKLTDLYLSRPQLLLQKSISKKKEKPNPWKYISLVDSKNFFCFLFYGVKKKRTTWLENHDQAVIRNNGYGPLIFRSFSSSPMCTF